MHRSLCRSAFHACAAIAATAFCASCEKSEPSSEGAAAAPPSTPVAAGPYVPVPGIDPSDPRYVTCWVHIESRRQDPSFRNPFDQVKGPIGVAFLRDLKTLNHADWSGRVTHVTTGATARAVLFEEENFGGRSYTAEPNSKAISIADVGLASLGSMTIEFAP